MSHFVAAVVLTAVIAFISGTYSALSFAAGAGASFLNLIALVYSWPRILAKKSVALSIGVIVIKFAILGWIIYEVVSSQALPLGWFAAGLGLVILSTVATSFNVTQQSREKVES